MYGVYLVPNMWQSIVTEQLNSIKQCGLYDDAQAIYVGVVGTNDELIKFSNFLESNFPKVQIKETSEHNTYQFPSFKVLYDIADNRDDECVVYMHTKGITHEDQKFGAYLRRLMMVSTIENYKEYIYKFESDSNIDVAGALPHKDGFMYMTFFWARSSYIRQYFDPPVECPPNIVQFLEWPIFTPERWVWEIWIGKACSKKENIVTYSPVLGYTQIKARQHLGEAQQLWENVYKSKLQDCG